MLWGKISP
jgi:hypothetical protein